MNGITISNYFGVAFCCFVVLAVSCPVWLSALLGLKAYSRPKARRPMRRDFTI